LTAVCPNPTTNTSSMLAPARCRSWCNDHTAFGDGSDNWHQSAPVVVGELEFYVSTGTLTGEPEVYLAKPFDSMSLEQAERAARALLATVGEVRR
jgi:hypothetical protein